MNKTYAMIALCGATLAAVAPAASGQLTEDLKLTASDAAAFDQFGWSVAIDNDVVAVGAVRDDDNGSSSGSAYLFDAATGAQLFKLTASDAAAGDRFGHSIAIGSGVVAVGANRDDDNGSSSGSAYLFDAATGVQLFKLLPSDGAATDVFGNAIAIDNGIVAVGGVLDDVNGSNTGSAYLFDATTGVQLAKLIASDGVALDQLGSSIAIDNGVVAAGAVGDHNSPGSPGSAYVFDLSSSPPCPGDIADDFGTLPPLGGADGMVSFGDFMAMLGLVGPCPGGTPGCDGDIADDFGSLVPLGGPDGMVGFGDFLALLGLVGPCP